MSSIYRVIGKAINSAGKDLLMWPISGRVHTPVSNPSLTLCNEAQYNVIGSPRKNCGGIVSWFVSGTVGEEVGGAYIAPPGKTC